MNKAVSFSDRLRGGLFQCLLLFFITVASVCAISCVSSKKSAEPVEYVPDPKDAVPIPMPEKQNQGYFFSISEEVLDLVENGSPESLRQAVFLLRKGGDKTYTESEKILLTICTSMMKYAWPSQQVNWNFPEVQTANPYTGALDSVQKGVFDLNTGNSDFFTILLPCFIVFTTSFRQQYYSLTEDSLKKVLKLKPESVIANYIYGIYAIKTEDYSSALTHFTFIEEKAPECQEVRYLRALCFRKLGHNEDALREALRQLEVTPDNVELLKLCSEIYFEDGSLDDAETYVNRVIQIEPDNQDYILFRTRILILRGDYIKASSLLDMYSRNDRTSRVYLLLRAQLQKDWNRNNKAAVETMSQALSLYPEDEEVLSFAASLASSSNLSINDSSALSLAQKLLSLYPSNRQALYVIMTEKAKSRDYSDAYSVSSKLIAETPDDVETVIAHVENCLLLRKYDEAYRYALRIYSENPESENTCRIYIKTLIEMGRYKEGLNLINRLLPDASSKMKSFLLYEKCFTESDESAMLFDLRQSLTANPRNQDTLYLLYKAYYDRKDWKKAQYYIRQVLSLAPEDKSIQAKCQELEKLLAK